MPAVHTCLQADLARGSSQEAVPTHTPCNDRASRSWKLFDFFMYYYSILSLFQYCYQPFLLVRHLSFVLYFFDSYRPEQIFFFPEMSSQTIFATDPMHRVWTSKDRFSQPLGPKQLMTTTDHASMNYIISLCRKYSQVPLDYFIPYPPVKKIDIWLQQILCILSVLFFLFLSQNYLYSTRFFCSQQFTSKQSTGRPRRTVYRPKQGQQQKIWSQSCAFRE